MNYSKSIFTCFTLIFFSSCAVLKKSNIEALSVGLKESMPNLCLSGEGRGRLSGPKQKIFFSFESINDLDKKLWSLALSIPLYGEELLRINWQDRDKVRVKGRLVKRLYKSMGKNRKVLKRSFQIIASFLKFHNKVSSRAVNDCDDSCEFEGMQVKVIASSQEKLSFSISKKNLSLRVKATDFDKTYQRLELVLEAKSKILGLDLFYDSCGALKTSSPDNSF